MTQSTLKKAKPYILKDENVSGTWVLTMSIENSLGAEGFGFYQLGSYPDPFSFAPRILRDPNGSPKNGVTITAIKTVFDTSNPIKKEEVLFLLGHPEVKIEGVKLEKKVLNTKKSNPKFTLVNIDAKDMEEFDNENLIDKIVGRLSLETGNQAISLKRLRWILATLNLSYFERRYVGNNKTEKKYLRSKLKKFVKASVDNASKVEEILSDLENAEYIYLIKEMLRFEILVYSYGSYKYNGEALGIDMESVIARFKETPELFNELKLKTLNKIDEFEQNE